MDVSVQAVAVLPAPSDPPATGVCLVVNVKLNKSSSSKSRLRMKEGFVASGSYEAGEYMVLTLVLGPTWMYATGRLLPGSLLAKKRVAG